MKLTTALLIFIIIAGCTEKKTYKSAKSLVVDTKARHLGRGYYKHEIFYRYFNGTDTVIGHSTADGTVRGMTARYIKGDSLLIGYNTKDGADTFISEMIYAKPRMK